MPYLKQSQGALNRRLCLRMIYLEMFSTCKLHSQVWTSFTRGKTNHSQWQLVLTYFDDGTTERANGNCKGGDKQLSLNI